MFEDQLELLVGWVWGKATRTFIGEKPTRNFYFPPLHFASQTVIDRFEAGKILMTYLLTAPEGHLVTYYTPRRAP